MMILRNFIFLIGAISLLSGCEKESDVPWVMSGHFVNRYVVPDSLSFVVRVSSLIDINVNIKGEYVSWDRDARFDSLARLNRDLEWRYKSSEEFDACAYPVSGVSVVSDADFDERHPAGSELSDIVKVSAGSLGDFVLSGYVDSTPDNVRVKWISQKPFSEFSDFERYLWYGGIGIYLPLPTLSRTHNLTVTFSFEGWKSVSSTVRVEL